MKKTPEKFREWIEKKIEVEFAPVKKTLEGEIINKNIRVGEFWWYYEGMNVGNEISKDGKHMRVCLILKSNLGNGLLLVAPITTNIIDDQTHFTLKSKITCTSD